jgi:hypothetical protein
MDAVGADWGPHDELTRGASHTPRRYLAVIEESGQFGVGYEIGLETNILSRCFPGASPCTNHSKVRFRGLILSYIINVLAARPKRFELMTPRFVVWWYLQPSCIV